MKARKAKLKENERPKTPKWKEIKVQKTKWKKIKAQKAKISKMKPGLALLNALCGTKTNGPFLATCGEDPTGGAPILKDTPSGASKV